jgi:hypothetical protein
VDKLVLTRPLSLHIMPVLRIILVSAAAACASFMRPLGQLIINVGGVVGLLIQVQDVLHRSDEGAIGLGWNAPLAL